MSLTGILVLLNEHLVDLVANLTLGELAIVLGGAILGHEGEETIVSNVELRIVSYGNIDTTRQLTSWYSRRLTLGTSMLWVEGERSSIFFEVKMSMATKWTLA